METKANYVVIGVFTLAVVAGVFGFVYWFQNLGGSGERAFYRIQFDGSVSGLRTGGGRQIAMPALSSPQRELSGETSPSQMATSLWRGLP